MTTPINDLMSPEELDDFATDYLGLNPSDVDLFYESYYNMDTELNYHEENHAREDTDFITY